MTLAKLKTDLHGRPPAFQSGVQARILPLCSSLAELLSLSYITEESLQVSLSYPASILDVEVPELLWHAGLRGCARMRRGFQLRRTRLDTRPSHDNVKTMTTIVEMVSSRLHCSCSQVNGRK